MNMDKKTAEEDLAFMRALVRDEGPDNRSFGINYLAAGVLYGLQCVVNGVLLISEAYVPTFVWMLAGWLPTILFLIVNFYTVWGNRAQPFGVGTARRAINAVFAGGGIANLVLAIIFGWVAYQKRDWSIWLLFPVVVCALQGAIWFATGILRRTLWYGVTAVGWFASALALGCLVDQTHAYILVLGAALFTFMALPGFLILRSSSRTPLQS